MVFAVEISRRIFEQLLLDFSKLLFRIFIRIFLKVSAFNFETKIKKNMSNGLLEFSPSENLSGFTDFGSSFRRAFVELWAVLSF